MDKFIHFFIYYKKCMKDPSINKYFNKLIKHVY